MAKGLHGLSYFSINVIYQDGQRQNRRAVLSMMGRRHSGALTGKTIPVYYKSDRPGRVVDAEDVNLTFWRNVLFISVPCFFLYAWADWSNIRKYLSS